MIYIKVLNGMQVTTYRFNEDQRAKALEFKAFAEECGQYVSLREEPFNMLNRDIAR
jgi:hypothetical protein